jgi:CDP-glucose 4,6-dehydratase
MRPEFWSGKRVLVTGHTGFKGSWLSLWLQRSGAEVIGYSLAPPSEPSLFQLAAVGQRMTNITGDVRNLRSLVATVRRHRPEAILHLAAQSLVRQSYRNPVATFDTNVMGTVNVLEAVRQTESVRVALIITSDKCYENREWAWGYRENEAMGGHDPYSGSKGCAEIVTSAYRRSFFTAPSSPRRLALIASGRAGNVIGGGDWAPNRLVPDVMTAFAQERPVVLRNPEAVRPWQHVLEPLNGYLMLAERLWDGEEGFASGWNFGAPDSESRPVQWIVERLSVLWGQGASWRLDTAENPHEAHYLRLDCSKARDLLGWRPRLSLETALEWIVEWYRHYQRSGDMRQLTMEQIDRFERSNSE